MAASKSTSIFPLGHMPRAKTVSNADGIAEIVRTTSGNAATLAGHVYGGPLLDDDTPNPAPRAPGHGLHGHDHSGGLYGRPLYRSLFSFNFSDHDLTVGAQPFSGNSVPRTRFGYAGVTASTTKTEVFPTRLPFFVPGCDPGPFGAYSRLAVSVLIWIYGSTSLQTGDKVRLGFNSVGLSGSAITYIDVDNLADGYNVITPASEDELVPMNPGQVNVLQVHPVEFITSSAVASRDIEYAIHCIEGGVYSGLTG